jgi:predicted nucleic acid-binding protein
VTSAGGRNVVDSSGWVEYLVDGPRADFYAEAIEDVERLVVPLVCVLEVFSWVLGHRGEGDALQTAALMQQGLVVELDVGLALRAAELGVQHQLTTAHAVVVATALAHDALIWTQDEDFGDLPNVRYARLDAG